MIDRESAFQLLESQNPEPHLIHHAIQTEAVMTGLAKHFGEDETLWALTGLLHDLDFPTTKETPEEHGKQSVKLLKGKLPEIALNAILAHNSEHTAHDPTTKLDLALRCAETVTGLIATNALVRPNGMEGMKPKSLKKKMKDKTFAASVSRDRIKECEKLDLELGQFFELAIEFITPIADAVGLAKRT